LIGAALRSVFAQTFTDFEVIVVDDGSGSGGLSAGSRAVQRAHSVVRQANGGPAKHATPESRVHRGSSSRSSTPMMNGCLETGLPGRILRRYPETGLLHAAVVDGAERAPRSTDRHATRSAISSTRGSISTR
jgi:hypothetical protein